MGDQLRDWSDQLLYAAFLLLPSALLIDAAILGIAVYALHRPDVVRWLKKRRQARILKRRFDVEIRQGDKTPVLLPKTYPRPAPGARPGPYDDEWPEKIRVHGWPYRPTKPQAKP